MLHTEQDTETHTSQQILSALPKVPVTMPKTMEYTIQWTRVDVYTMNELVPTLLPHPHPLPQIFH